MVTAVSTVNPPAVGHILLKIVSSKIFIVATSAIAAVTLVIGLYTYFVAKPYLEELKGSINVEHFQKNAFEYAKDGTLDTRINELRDCVKPFQNLSLPMRISLYMIEFFTPEVDDEEDEINLPLSEGITLLPEILAQFLLKKGTPEALTEVKDIARRSNMTYLATLCDLKEGKTKSYDITQFPKMTVTEAITYEEPNRRVISRETDYDFNLSYTDIILETSDTLARDVFPSLKSIGLDKDDDDYDFEHTPGFLKRFFKAHGYTVESQDTQNIISYMREQVTLETLRERVPVLAEAPDTLLAV